MGCGEAWILVQREIEFREKRREDHEVSSWCSEAPIETKGRRKHKEKGD